MIYLDPKSDLTFKKVFGQHPHLLKSFLNAMLPLPEGSYIEKLEYLPSDLVPEIPLMKYSIVDVRCYDNYGRQFIVEMQLEWTTGFMQRVLFNASKAYVKQLDRSYEYKSLQPVYALSLVNDVFMPDKAEYYHHYKIVNVADTNQQLKGLEFVFVELPKFKPTSVAEKKLQVLWLRFLTEIDENTREVPSEILSNPEISEAIENLRTSAYTKGELEYYDRYWDSVRCEKTLFSEYYDKGRDAGIKAGREEGQKIVAVQIAEKAIRLGMSVDEVATLTGLSDDEIQKLESELR